MTTIAIVFHSGYGHTKRVADHVLIGAASADAKVELVAIDSEGNIPDAAWETLKRADGIIFGSPTYMGNVSWQFKKFADASSKTWFKMEWKGKVAAGFTNSASLNGDKGSTISYLSTFAAHHKMLWTGTDMHPSAEKSSTRDDINHLGGYLGLLVATPGDASVEEMIPGDLKTAEVFGANVAAVVKRLADASHARYAAQ
ncbi:flavodoxin family protein [Pseudoduganella namucuonensis]|uniref:Flavoprotein WrbA n=1 Tax=Pseudoduganella namucuonensis TaxID=1035707 RepID=A0A1I7G4C8_9BURK|nr:flavodoxin family protein [Pseudoduganella namucuonensis]SFU43335.1 NAD(P)H dehydrogenase (quinone) [Pseudoduganella namucuonensis]